MNKKITQKQLAFYLLYKSMQKSPDTYMEIWRFIGEVFVEELKEWGFMSYTCVHRTFEVFDENPGLIERRITTGKSGSKFYEYRIVKGANAENIKDPRLLEFYKKIRQNNV